jgi:hypothetical protein
MEILVVIVVHLLVALLLGGFGEVDVLAASATRAVDDVVGGDGLEVIVGGLLLVFIVFLCCGRVELAEKRKDTKNRHSSPQITRLQSTTAVSWRAIGLWNREKGMSYPQ